MNRLSSSVDRNRVKRPTGGYHPYLWLPLQILIGRKVIKCSWWYAADSPHEIGFVFIAEANADREVITPT